jgi:hypothetical protein
MKAHKLTITVICVVLAFAASTFIMTVFMPAAELIPAQVHEVKPISGDSPIRSKEIMQKFEELAKIGLKIAGKFDSVHAADLSKLIAEDPNYPYYLYSFFLGAALIASAIAICAVGRLDAEEETVIPVKK